MRSFLTLLLSLSLIAAACSSATTDASADSPTDSATDSSAPADSDSSDIVTSTGEIVGGTDDELNTIAIVERFAPSTAAIAVTVAGQRMVPVSDSTTLDQIPQVDVPVQQSSGSGFVVELDDTPFVVTNFHVVQDTLEPGTSTMFDNSTIDATFPGGGPVALNVVGVNPSFDLALLEPIDSSNPIPEIWALPLADSDEVQVGQKTIAIGNPFGLGATVTTGAVSSVGRLVQSVGMVSIPMIQTDAAINPGNSGGALINSSGELIGINTSIFNPETRAFAGIGFAVPSNLLTEALANLELGGVSSFGDTRPVFGAQLGTLALLPEEVRNEAGLPESGVAVLDVAPGGPAELAGLSRPEFVNVLGITVPEDPVIIVSIDGRPVNTAEDLNLAISYESDLGQEVTLTVLRNGVEEDIVVALGG